MAERVVDRILEKTDALQPCRTDKIALAQSTFENLQEVHRYTQAIAHWTEDMDMKGGVGAYLVHLYGQQATEILDATSTRTEEDPELRLTLAELTYAVRTESVIHAEDFLVRRTGWLYFDIHRLKRMKEPVLSEMAALLQWTPEQITRERAAIEAALRSVALFSNE